MTPHHVLELHDPGPDSEAHDRHATLGSQGTPLVARQAGAAPRVAQRLPGGLLGAALRGELVGRAEAFVGKSVGLETLAGVTVRLQPLHLAVRPVGAPGGQARHLGPLVPGQTQPVQPLEDVPLVREGGARHVGVLEAQHEGAALAAGEEVVEERGSRRPDVERPGGAGCDAAADAHGRRK